MTPCDDLRAGMSYAAVGRKYGFSRQRAHQLAVNAGIVTVLADARKKQAAERAAERATGKRQAGHERLAALHGATVDEYLRLKAIGAVQAYVDHKANAVQRGIAFTLSLAEWWGIWEASGRWKLRGVRRGCFVMARNGDVGPYASGNVRIISHADNTREAVEIRLHRENC